MKLLLLFFLSSSLLLSAPAFYGKKSFSLQNGNSFQGYVKGDEYLHWIESDSGEIIVFNKVNNQYEYAEIKDDELIASGIEKNLHVKKRESLQTLRKEDLYKLWKKKRSQEFKRRINN